MAYPVMMSSLAYDQQRQSTEKSADCKSPTNDPKTSLCDISNLSADMRHVYEEQIRSTPIHLLSTSKARESIFGKLLEGFFSVYEEKSYNDFIAVISVGISLTRPVSLTDAMMWNIIRALVKFLHNQSCASTHPEKDLSLFFDSLIEWLGICSDATRYETWKSVVRNYIAYSDNTRVMGIHVCFLANLFAYPSLDRTKPISVQERQKNLVFDILPSLNSSVACVFLRDWISNFSPLVFTGSQMSIIINSVSSELTSNKICFFYHLCETCDITPEQKKRVCEEILKGSDLTPCQYPFKKFARKSLAHLNFMGASSRFCGLLKHSDLKKYLSIFSSLKEAEDWGGFCERSQKMMEECLLNPSEGYEEAVCCYTQNSKPVIEDSEGWIKVLEDICGLYQFYHSKASDNVRQAKICSEALYFFLCEFNASAWQLSIDHLSRIMDICTKFIENKISGESSQKLIWKIYIQLVLRGNTTDGDFLAWADNWSKLFHERSTWVLDPKVELVKIFQEQKRLLDCHPEVKSGITDGQYCVILEYFLYFFTVEDKGLAIALSVAEALKEESYFSLVLKCFHVKGKVKFGDPADLALIMKYYETLISEVGFADAASLENFIWMIQTFKTPSAWNNKILLQFFRNFFLTEPLTYEHLNIILEIFHPSSTAFNPLSAVSILIEISEQFGNLKLFCYWLTHMYEKGLIDTQNPDETEVILRSYRGFIQKSDFISRVMFESFFWVAQKFSTSTEWNRNVFKEIIGKASQEIFINAHDFADIIHAVSFFFPIFKDSDFSELSNLADKFTNLRSFYESLLNCCEANVLAMNLDQSDLILEIYSDMLSKTKYVKGLSMDCLELIIEVGKLSYEWKAVLVLKVIEQLNATLIIDYEDLVTILKLLNPSAIDEKGLGINSRIFLKDHASQIRQLLRKTFRFSEVDDMKFSGPDSDELLEMMRPVLSFLPREPETGAILVGDDLVDHINLNLIRASVNHLEKTMNVYLKRLELLFRDVKSKTSLHGLAQSERFFVLADPRKLSFDELKRSSYKKIITCYNRFQNQEKFCMIAMSEIMRVAPKKLLGFPRPEPFITFSFRIEGSKSIIQLHSWDDVIA